MPGAAAMNLRLNRRFERIAQTSGLRGKQATNSRATMGKQSQVDELNDDSGWSQTRLFEPPFQLSVADDC